MWSFKTYLAQTFCSIDAAFQEARSSAATRMIVPAKLRAILWPRYKSSKVNDVRKKYVNLAIHFKATP
jgi:hypothetical protein